jgi:predicted LPLAT superfamily acyltransferase
MANWEGKTRGGLTGYRIFVFFIKTCGITCAYGWIYPVALYFLLVHRKPYKHIFHYFNHILGYGKVKSFISSYRNFCLIGKTLVDKVAILSGHKEKFTFEFDGEEYLRQITSQGTGGLLINAHIGNWDIAGQLLERLSTKTHVLMFDAERQQISKYLEQVMTEKNVHIIVIKEDMSHLSEIREALCNKEIIAMNGDRFVEGNKTYEIEFLGKNAQFPAGPFSIACKFDVPVTFAFAMKERKTHYHFYATPLLKVGTFKTLSQREDVIRGMVQKYAQELEKKVRMYPLQWFNYYPFWNTKQ